MRAAVTALIDHGYEATSIAELASVTGLSKAAFSYHFDSKDALLVEIAAPLLRGLEDVAQNHPASPNWPDGIRALLADYLDVLIEHGDVVTWIDGDKAVLNHPELGEQLRQCNVSIRRALTGGDWSDRARVQSAAILGMLWRPMRNLDAGDVKDAREALLTLAVDAVGTVRRGE